MLNANHVWNIAFKVARWITLTALLLTLFPLLLLLIFGIFILVPKGRTWAGYWGHTLAEGTRAVWHWVFGPPKVRVQRPHHRHAPGRKARFTNWRN